MSQRRDATAPSTGFHVEVFDDGAALVAVDISNTSDESGPYEISEEWLSMAMVAALGLVGQLCVDVAGAAGTAMAVAEIVEPHRGEPRHRERSMMLTAPNQRLTVRAG